MRTRNSGAILVLLSALMFGSYGVWSRLIGGAMDNFFQGWTRALIILLIITPVLLWRREAKSIEKSDIKWLVTFLIFTSLTQAPLFYAFNHMDIGTATLLFFVSMFLTMYAVGWCFLGERMTRIKVFASVMAIVGMCLVFSFSIARFSLFAALMAVLNGIASGGEIAFSKKLTHAYTPLYIVTLSWGIILLTNLIVSLSLGEHQLSMSLSAVWFWQLCYSLAASLGFGLVIAGFRYVDAGVGALLGLLEIVFGIVFGVYFFGETITPSIFFGSILIIGAAVIHEIVEHTRVSRN